MSYDVRIGDFDANYTSNAGKLYHRHIERDDETGLQALHGLTGKQAHALIAQALDRIHHEYVSVSKSGEIGARSFCAQYDAPNGWGSTAGALIFLARIAAACAENPRKRVSVCA
jgi:hypothetical protein